MEIAETYGDFHTKRVEFVEAADEHEFARELYDLFGESEKPRFEQVVMFLDQQLSMFSKKFKINDRLKIRAIDRSIDRAP